MMKKITFYLFILRLLRMSLSIVTLIFSAKYFGVSLERDVWILVTTFVTTLGSAVWGPINETFRTKFIFIREKEGISSAASKTVSLVGYIIAITFIIGWVILMFKAPLAYYFSAEQTSSKSIELFSLLLVVMLPSILINQLTQIGISILNAYDIYYVPEIIGTFSSLINIIIIVLLAPLVGIFSLAVSQYVALFLLLVAILCYLKGLNLFHWRDVSCIRYGDFHMFLLFSLPFFIPYFVGQCNVMAEKWLANLQGEGYVSSLDYAKQFTVVLQNAISSVLTTVMVPLLSKLYARNEQNVEDYVVKENITVCFTILALFIPVLFGAARPLCEFFFLRGEISLKEIELIIVLMRMYAFSFIGVLLYMVFGYILLANNQLKKYTLWGVFAQISILIINISLVDYIGIYIFPVSLGGIHLIAAVIMSTYLLFIDDKKMIYFQIMKYCVVIILMALIIYLFNSYIILSVPFWQLIINIPVLILLYILLSYWLDMNIFLYARRIYLKIKCK